MFQPMSKYKKYQIFTIENFSFFCITYFATGKPSQFFHMLYKNIVVTFWRKIIKIQIPPFELQYAKVIAVD